MTLIIILLGMMSGLFRIQKVEASGTIYIKADGGVDPSTAPISSVDNVTYTFTDNINDSIVVERDNIVVDGAGYTVEGTGAYGSKGINLTFTWNITIKNMKIKAFENGIFLSGSYYINILGNEITGNEYGIFIREYSNFNSIYANNITSNSQSAIFITGSYKTNASKNNIANNKYGVFLYDTYGPTIISENNIEANSRYGVALIYCSWYYDSANTAITQNNIANNNDCGIFVYSSSNNIIVGNNIANTTSPSSGVGVWLEGSSRNAIFHNNFLENRVNAYTWRSYVNQWDDGFPSGGNFWSNHTVVDSNLDGIADSPYVIDGDNQDNYPSTDMIFSFDAYNYRVSIISNSSVSNFNFSITGPWRVTLTLNATGETGTQGFCRICIPKALINGSYVVKFNGEVITYPQVRELPGSNELYECLYINYTHSEHVIEISGTSTISEFPSFLILPLFMVATLLVTVCRRKIPSNYIKTGT